MLGAVTLLLFSAIGSWLAGIWPTAMAACASCNTRSCDFHARGHWLRAELNGYISCCARCKAGFGGEWAVGSVLMGEIVRAEHRAKQ